MPKANIDFGGMTMMTEEAEPQAPFWQTAAIVVFFIGLVVTLGYTLQSILRVWLLIRHSEQHPQNDGTVICVAKGDVSPFSWMRYIVLSQSDYEAQDASILAHERGHIRRRHSLDLILVDTLTALQWFNPAMWMLRQDLRAIHEYEADAAVLSQGINMRQYQYLLIQKAVSHCGYSVANGISHSTLKNRINMMLTNKKSTSKSWIKVFALLPIVGLALALNAETVNDYVYKEEQQQPQAKVVKKGKKVVVKAKKPEEAEKPFDVVEQMPEFPGGMPELMKFLQENVKYPEEAMKNGIQGRVLIQFIVEKDGSISEAKVIKKVNELLDAEALRVIGEMPKWTPGKQKGQEVRVKFVLPVTFRLS
jgi:TonB family protein